MWSPRPSLNILTDILSLTFYLVCRNFGTPDTFFGSNYHVYPMFVAEARPSGHWHPIVLVLNNIEPLQERHGCHRFPSTTDLIGLATDLWFRGWRRRLAFQSCCEMRVLCEPPVRAALTAYQRLTHSISRIAQPN